MTDDTTHPYPEREYPPVTPEYRAALVLLARRQYLAKLERERCQTTDDERREVA